MQTLTTALDNAADGALIIDDQQNIVYANQPARRMLRFELKHDRKQPCYGVLRGMDSERRLICKRECRVLRDCENGLEVPSCVIQVDMSEGGYKQFGLSVLHFRDQKDGRLYIVHLLREAYFMGMRVQDGGDNSNSNGNKNGLYADDKHSDEPLRRFADLTERERQILGYLVRGQGTREIADSLSIAVNTTRNHIQHILQKLDVHSRAEAVAYAARHDLFTRWRQTRWW